MFDQESFFESLNECRRAGDTVFVPFNGLSSIELRSQVGGVLNAWSKTNGVETGITEETSEGIVCMVAHIKPGSPKRSRVLRPWFYMEIGEARFVSDKEYAPGSLRVYVSQFCARMEQRITVNATKGGCTITRTK